MNENEGDINKDSRMHVYGGLSYENVTKCFKIHQEIHNCDSLTQPALTTNVIEAIDIDIVVHIAHSFRTIYGYFVVFISAPTFVILYYEYIDHFGAPSRFDSYIRHFFLFIHGCRTISNAFIVCDKLNMSDLITIENVNDINDYK